MSKRLFAGLLFSVIVGVVIGFAIGRFLNTMDILELEKSNSELQKKNFDLQSMLKIPAGMPPIVTRFGVKLMDNGLRYKYYLWVTGEVQNNGSLTAYNVTVLFTLHTSLGVMLKAINLGTFAPFQVLPFRHEVDANGEYIKSWEITPQASYTP